MRFTIVTPCFNAEHLLHGTVESIYGQTAVRSGRVNLEYVVCDGASRDRTVEVARAASGGHALIHSEPDRGMYEALAHGLRAATGDVVAYLNAGDSYHPSAFDVVADVFEQGHVAWVTGLTVLLNERDQVVNAILPFRYRRRFLAKALYGRLLPYVEQESTFWARRLHDGIDFERLATFRSAGDAYLWRCLSQQAELAIVESYLGGFKHHPGQKCEDLATYQQELACLGAPPSWLDRALARADAWLWAYAGARLKKTLNPRLLLRFDAREGIWH